MIGNVSFTSVKVFKSDIKETQGTNKFLPIGVYQTNGLKINQINPRDIMKRSKNMTVQDMREQLTDYQVMQIDKGNYWQVIANDIVKEAKIAHALRNSEEAMAPNTVLVDDVAPEIDIPQFMQNKR